MCISADVYLSKKIILLNNIKNKIIWLQECSLNDLKNQRSSMILYIITSKTISNLFLVFNIVINFV